MACRYEYTEKARMDLNKILNYITVDLANSLATQKFMLKLDEVIEEICLFPKSGKWVENKYLPSNIIRKKLVKIIYIYLMKKKMY